MAQLVLAVALETARARKFGDLTDGRPRLARGSRRSHNAPPCWPRPRPGHASASTTSRAAKRLSQLSESLRLRARRVHARRRRDR